MPTARKILAQILPFTVLFLIFFGALVTSNGAGLSVPDWPQTFGQNMFLYPIEHWVGGIFYEHLHRLIASTIGFLTLILTIWICYSDQRSWLKKLSIAALLAVVLQGVLGGLTVLYKLPTAISASHAVLAQTFLVLTIIIAYAYSKELNKSLIKATPASRSLIKYTLILFALIYVQLIIGAVMRHSASGLAIPDFPTMGGSWLPSLNAETIGIINQQLQMIGVATVSANQVLIHLLHRATALLVTIATTAFLAFGFKVANQLPRKIIRHVNLIFILVVVQVLLGIYTVLSVKNPEITSLHVLFGAVLLATVALLACRLIFAKKEGALC